MSNYEILFIENSLTKKYDAFFNMFHRLYHQPSDIKHYLAKSR